MDTIKGQLREAGYDGVELRERPTTQWVPEADGVGKLEPATALDLYLYPAQGQVNDKHLVQPGGRFAGLDVLDAAGIRYDKGGVHVFNGHLIVPNLSNDAKEPGSGLPPVARRKDRV